MDKHTPGYEVSAKPTPGPWAAEPERLTISPRSRKETHVVGRSPKVRHDDQTIAQVCRTPRARMDGRDPEAEANARLIAAAPELLAALRYLVAHVNGSYLPAHPIAQAVEDARAAIAKAEGRT